MRIDDLDQGRAREHYVDDQLRTLCAFGLQWDGEPIRQTTRQRRYAEVFEQLARSGVVYGCRCTRRRLHGLEVYDGRCRSLGLPLAAHQARIRVPQVEVALTDAVQGRRVERLDLSCGDYSLRKADGEHTYALATVVDDHDLDISTVVRGADLWPASARQHWLAGQLGLRQPQYLHLPLVVDDDGRKLSKSTAALPVDPQDPLPALHAALRLLGLAPLGEPRAELELKAQIERYAVELIPRLSTVPLPRLQGVHNGGG